MMVPDTAFKSAPSAQKKSNSIFSLIPGDSRYCILCWRCCRMNAQLEQDIYDYYHFQPSRDIAIVALSLYLAVALAILILTIKARSWFMLIPTIVGLLEMGGYACRIRMLSHPLRGVYIAQQCLLIIPPSFLALIDYIVLGRLVKMIQAAKPPTSSSYRNLKPKWLTWSFFTVELISLALQGAGAGISSSSDDGPGGGGNSQTVGRILLIIGLAALVCVIIFFLTTLIYVSTSPIYRVNAPALKPVYAGLYITVALLLIRNIFRLIEFGQGWHGGIADHEVYFYVFDGLMMLIWLLVVLPLHFGILLRPVQTQLGAISSGGVAPVQMATMNGAATNSKPFTAAGGSKQAAGGFTDVNVNGSIV
ncbi:hypothetical protein WJX74_007151 [Apatococcus lobatus]|uniref:Uncharacterized protein n=1 Tax=Apatococcus lobatus TaxID=904363 RepID=A0AAW1SBE4_9CHLO